MQVEKCIEEIRNEIGLINELIGSHDLLLKKATTHSLDRIEISAAGALLHSFYNGIENIFQRIANRLDKKIPSSEFWHQELLEQMKTGNQQRGSVLSDKMYEKLKPYLGFRHFFRHSYAFQFKWVRIKPLLLELPDVYNEFKEEITLFMEQSAAV